MKELAGNVSRRTDILNRVLKGREMHFRDLEYYIVGHLVVVVVGGGRGRGVLSDQKDCIQGVAILLAKLT